MKKTGYQLFTREEYTKLLHEIGSWLLFLFLLSILLFVSSFLGPGFIILVLVICSSSFAWHKWESTTTRKIDKLTTKANRYFISAIEEIGKELYEKHREEQDNTNFLVHMVKMTNLHRKLVIRYAEDKQKLLEIAHDWLHYCEAIWQRNSVEHIKEIELKFRQAMLFP